MYNYLRLFGIASFPPNKPFNNSLLLPFAHYMLYT